MMADDTLIALGQLTKPHGLRGELRLHPFNPETTAFTPGTVVTLCRDGVQQQRRVRTVRRHQKVLLVTFDGCDSIEAAQGLVGSDVCLQRQQLPPVDAGEIYHYQLVGLRVVTTAGRDLGRVAEVLSLGSNDVCVVRDGEREHLIPLIADVVRTIDPEGGRLVIEPLPGLLDE
jgi:16S rRNA processing protein RimM